MNDLLKQAFNYTFFTLTFTPPDGQVFGLFFWSTVNTVIRAAAIYGAIRVVATALNHGSF